MGKKVFQLMATAAILAACLVFVGVAGAAEGGKKVAGQDRFAKCDADKDGFLDKSEFKACFPRMKPENADKRFAAVDADKDGKISKAEWKAARTKIQERKAAGQDRFAKCDADKDGFLDKSEFKACFPRMKPENVDKRFAAVDTDKDGKISKAEWKAARAKMQERAAAKAKERQAKGI